MSLSRYFTSFYTAIAVQVQRSIRLIMNGNAKKTYINAKLLPTYFERKYLLAVKDLTQKPITVEAPETIWQFWDNPAGRTTPDIVKASFKTVEQFKGNFEHKILDNSTVGNYSDLPGYIFDRLKKRQMRYAHFADLLRLNLLKNHGGVWMDATVYMTDFIPERITNQDFFVFFTGELTSFPYSFAQNCFIRAKIGSFLCEAWYRMCVEYWKNEARRVTYFQHQLMFKTLVLKNPIARDLFTKMPHLSEDETHRLTGSRLIKKFDANEWESIRKASFFQKTRYMIKKRKIADAKDYPETYFSKLCDAEC
ncbi:hypothetical protein R80B4_00771 [Fibrobacteres bacterium R8-0-B4]